MTREELVNVLKSNIDAPGRNPADVDFIMQRIRPQVIDDLISLFDQEKKAYCLAVIGEEGNQYIADPENDPRNMLVWWEARNKLRVELRRKVQGEE